MIVARSSSLIRLQVAISGSVRKQPRHRPDAPSIVQTMTQGVATARGGLAGEGAGGWLMFYDVNTTIRPTSDQILDFLTKRSYLGP